MNEPDGTGSEHEKDRDEGIVLPSWIDAAISRTRGPEDVPAEDVPSRPDGSDEPAYEDPPTEEHVPPSTPPSSESFPSFLDRRDSMAYETERVIHEEPAYELAAHEVIEQAEPVPMHDSPLDFLSRPAMDEFDAQREEIVTQAMADDGTPRSEEPIPLPVAPPRRRAPSGPWLMAAIFFAAAALVLAVLIWLKPLQ